MTPCVLIIFFLLSYLALLQIQALKVNPTSEGTPVLDAKDGIFLWGVSSLDTLDQCVDMSSCAGSSNNNSFNNNIERNCFCDQICHVYDDCCADYVGKMSDYFLSFNAAMFSELRNGMSCVDKWKLTGVSDDDVKIYMMNKCPRSFGNKFVKESCENPPANDPFLKLPVSGVESHLLYNNYYCAYCNNDLDVLLWKVRYMCNEHPNVSFEGKDSPEISQDTLIRLLAKDCYAQYEDPGILTRQCVEVVNTCATDWTDGVIIKKCQERTSYVYDIISRRTYRNNHCALCNHVNETECGFKGKESLNVDMNLGHIPYNIFLDVNMDRQKDSRIYLNGKQMSALEMRHCASSEIFDIYSNDCRKLYCSGTAHLINGTCVNVNITSGDVKCQFYISLAHDEFQRIDNGSLYVFNSRQWYTTEEYELQGDLVLICLPYTDRNYTTGTWEMFKYDQIQGLMSFIGVLISLVALFILIVVYLIFPPLRNLPGKCLLSFVFCLFIAQLLYLVGVPRTEYHSVCVTCAVVLHYTFLASFFWMNSLAFDITRTFSLKLAVSSISNTSKQFVIYSIYSWGAPAIVVTISLAVDLLADHMYPNYKPDYGNGMCWITNGNGLLVFFIVPQAALVGINIILFVITVYKICTVTNQAEVARGKKQTGRFLLYIKLSFIMGFTWIFGYLAAMLDNHVLWYVFIVFNALQGVYICVAFVCTKRVCRLMVKKRKKIATDRSTTHSRGYVPGKSSSTSRPTKFTTLLHDNDKDYPTSSC